MNELPLWRSNRTLGRVQGCAHRSSGSSHRSGKAVYAADSASSRSSAPSRRGPAGKSARALPSGLPALSLHSAPTSSLQEAGSVFDPTIFTRFTVHIAIGLCKRSSSTFGRLCSINLPKLHTMSVNTPKSQHASKQHGPLYRRPGLKAHCHKRQPMHIIGPAGRACTEEGTHRPGSASRKLMSSWCSACATSSRCRGLSSAKGTDPSSPSARKRSPPPSHACRTQLPARAARTSTDWCQVLRPPLTLTTEGLGWVNIT